MKIDTTARARTGVSGLDRVLGGGLPRNHLYLVCGPSGAGKTTLAMQFLIEGARTGERSLYIGTSETTADIEAVAAAHGWNLQGVVVRHHDGLETPVPGLQQTMLHPAEVELPRTMEHLMNLVEEVQPERLVVDSLSEIRILSREENWFREQIKVFQRRLARRRCTVLVTELEVDPRSVLRSSVHGIIELEQHPKAFGPDHRSMRVAKVRGIDFVTGFHAMAIETGGIRVSPRLVAERVPQRPSVLETISTGIPRLDSLLGGGLDRGTATLIQGPTGTGKSSLATYFAVHLARRDEKASIYSFDERLQTMYQRSAGIGIPLEEHVESGLLQVRQIDPVETSLGRLTQQVLRDVEDGARLLVLDSLNDYADAVVDPRLLGAHLHELTSYLNRQSVITLYVMTQSGLPTSALPDLNISYIAETVILVRSFDFGGAMHNAVSVHKRRAGAHEKTVRELDMSQGTIALGRPLEAMSGVVAGPLHYEGDSLPPPGDAGDAGDAR